MAVSTTNRKAGPFVGNDATTVFPFTFKVFDAEDLLVVLTDDVLVENTLILDTDYTVILNGDQDDDPGGSVTLTDALVTGTLLTITSQVSATQTVVLTSQGGFYPNVLNRAFDKLTIIVQQLAETVGRTIRLPLSSTANGELPVPSPNALLAWNGTGDGFTNVDITSLVTAGAYGTARVETFEGTGAQIDFDLANSPGTVANVLVFIGGVAQVPGVDFSLVSSRRIRFTEAPFDGGPIQVRYATGGVIPASDDLLRNDGSNPAAGLLANIGAVALSALAAISGAGLVGYSQGGLGSVLRTILAKLRDGPISTADWGITADSNGTTGNGTDWTTQLQSLVTYARANGRNIWIPSRPGFYIRFTAPIDFTGAQTKMEVIGESNFDSAFFADFTSASNVAAFSNNGTSGARSYVAWRNFRLQGRIGAPDTNKVRGIYSNWGGEFTEFEGVFLFHFWDNIVVANDYTVRFTNCLSWYARNDCIQTGYDITGAIGACNTVSYIGTVTTHAGRYGKYTSYCRAAVISGGSDEACAGGNTFLDSVSGFDISGHYVEYAPSEPGNPPVQVWLRNCNGGTVNGLSASAFDNAGNPVILVQDSASISLKGLAIEQVGAALDAVGVLIDNSTVEVSGFFQGLSKGVVASNGGRVTITNSNILATIPVSTGAGAGCVITWKDAVDAQVAASVASINAISAVDIYRTTLNKNIIDNTKNFQGVGTQGNLAAAAQVTVINAELASESYRIDNIRLEVVDAFAGGGGDRNLVIRDSTTIYSTIPAASLQLLGARGLWDSAVVPLPTGGALTPTVAGGDLYIQYAGGTTDYTTGGVVVLYVEATRIT